MTTKTACKYDHDMAGAEVPAEDLIAGDLVPGLGVLDAILDDGEGALMLCSGDNMRRVQRAEEVDVFPAMCTECAMHPDDCAEYGCGQARYYADTSLDPVEHVGMIAFAPEFGVAGIVDRHEGGVIAYAPIAHADRIVAALNKED